MRGLKNRFILPSRKKARPTAPKITRIVEGTFKKPLENEGMDKGEGNGMA